MFCGTCGKKIDDSFVYCDYCGAKVHGFERPALPGGPAAIPVLRSLAKAASDAPEPAPAAPAPEAAEGSRAPVPAADAPAAGPAEKSPLTPDPELVPEPAPRPAGRIHGGVIAAMVLGTCSLALAFLDAFSGLICGIIAVIFGAMNLKRRKPDRPFCIAGFSAGVIGVILCVVLMILAGEITFRLGPQIRITPYGTPDRIVENGDFDL